MFKQKYACKLPIKLKELLEIYFNYEYIQLLIDKEWDRRQEF